MPFYDLNVAYNADHATLSNTLLFAKELAYDVVAVAVSITGKLPPRLPTVPLSTLKIPNDLRTLTRVTLTISDASQNHQLNNLRSNYDLVAIRPTDEKTFQTTCTSLECDLISLDLSQPIFYLIKFTTVSAALQRGVRFEIDYAPGIVLGKEARRNLIAGATTLIRATRGRGIVISSEASNALGLRAPADVINLAQVWGLPQQRAKEAVCEEPASVDRVAGLRRTSYRGVVEVIDGGARPQHATKENLQGMKQNNTAPRKNEARMVTEKVTAHSEDKALAGTKRKAPSPSPKSTMSEQQADERPISKSEKKRRAKRARLEEQQQQQQSLNGPKKNNSDNFPVQHESLASEKPK